MDTASRHEKVEALLEDVHAIKRGMTFHGLSAKGRPRITPSQMGALMLIGHCSQGARCSVKGIASAMGITSSAATQLIDGLVASGYVVKEEDKRDRRVVVLALSKKSKKHIEAIKRDAARQFMQIFAALDDREFSQYCALTRKAVRGFNVPRPSHQ